MRIIESELHEVLSEIAPDLIEQEEQSLIIAEATALYNEALTIRMADSNRHTPEQHHRNCLLDSVLNAMEKMAKAEIEQNGEVVLNNRCADISLVSLGIRLSGAMGDMAILEDDDFDNLFKDDNDLDDNLWNISDIYDDELFRNELYNNPKQPRHRTDSVAR